jgi:peptidoglycan biosynthesis protein MviN/MurJ (putative lipid II flippase)
MNASYSLIVGLGKARFPLVVGASSAALNVALDLALIPGHAAVGAAVANSAAQGATALGTILYGVRLAGPVRWEAAILARAGAASAVAGVAAWGALALVGGAPGVVAGILAGSAVFVACAVVLRIVPGEDAEWIEGSFGRGVGALARRVAAS